MQQPFPGIQLGIGCFIFLKSVLNQGISMSSIIVKKLLYLTQLLFAESIRIVLSFKLNYRILTGF
ncbi:hypothetical protein M5W75_00690 [Paenibacillus larvae]|uniref:hypothetical protein n=1 Tax=Paenibacillus larvae TaxID=1464 RepID=UPI002280F644|nr:hypothetical protein [Paenibacillus larvae]MCY9748406.1 hypothetical protein [Paenibacillus larvae]